MNKSRKLAIPILEIIKGLISTGWEFTGQYKSKVDESLAEPDYEFWTLTMTFKRKKRNQ